MAVYRGKIDIVNMSNITASAGVGIQRIESLYAISDSGVIPPDLVDLELTTTENPEGYITFLSTGATFHITPDGYLLAQQGDQTINLTVNKDDILIGVQGWDNEFPELHPGDYLWTKTIYHYTNGQKTITYSVSLMGATGPEGNPGPAGAAVSSYRLVCNQSEVLKFVDKNGTTTITPEILKVAVYKDDPLIEGGAFQIDDLDISKFIVELYNIKTETWILISNDYITLDNLFNFNIDLKSIIEKGNEEGNIAANQLLYSECMIKLSYTYTDLNDDTSEEQTFNIVDFVSVRYSMNKDMAQLSVEAYGIVASMQNSQLEFNATGLTIQNGSFIIKHTDSKEPLLYSENGSLALKGNIYAENGYFKGNITGATGTFSGRLEANEGYFGGTLEAATGSFSGDISAAYGDIGGFTIGTTQLTSKSKDEKGNANIILNGENGIIEANNIILGTGATIKEYIKVGDTVQIKNAIDSNDSFIKVNNADNQEILTLNANGSINIGNGNNLIEINGAEGYIQSVNYRNLGTGWKISNTNSIFNDVTVRGSIRASVLEYGETQAIGGALVVRPSSRILESVVELDDKGNYFTTLTLEAIKGFEVGDYCRIDTDLIKQYYKILSMDVDNKKIIIEGSANNVQTYPIIDFGHTIITKDEDGKIISKDYPVGISINGSTDSSFLTPQAITVFDFNEETKAINPRIILGKLPNIPLYGYAKGTYGLYAENVLLKGSLVTQTGEGAQTVYSGISTLYTAGNSPTSNKYSEWFGNNTGEILLWAGAEGTSKEQVENSKFFVDKNGNLFAGSGYFKGTIITDATITASAIETATLRGAGEKPALTIEDAQKGIHFVSYEDNILNTAYSNWEQSTWQKDLAFKYKNSCSILGNTRYFLSLGNQVKKIILQFYNNSDLISTQEGAAIDFESFYTPEGATSLQVYFQIEIESSEDNIDLQTVFNNYKIIPELKKYINVFEVTKDSITANVSSFNLNSNFAIGNNGSLVIPNLYVIGENAGGARNSTGAAIMFDKNKISYTDSFDQNELIGSSSSYLDFQSGIKFSADGLNKQLELSRDEIGAKTSVRLESGIFFGTSDNEAMEYRPIKNDKNELIGYDLYIE